MVLGSDGPPAFAEEGPGSGAGGDWFDTFVNLNANVIASIDAVVGSAGVAIILYTVLVKAITYPLSQPALRTSAMLQLVSPQVQLIQLKYKENDELKNSMLRRLYAEVGVEPVSALLPIFVQLPVFIGLFRAIGKLASQDDHFKESFLWIPSLAGPVAPGRPSLDWLLKSQFSDHFEPLVGWHDAGLYCCLPIIVVLSQIFTQRMSSTQQDQGAAEIVFPLFIGISTLVSPAGLGLYWLTNNLLTGGQMSLVQQQIGEEMPEYKRIRDTARENAPADGVRYTRESPFMQDSEAVRESVAALESPTVSTRGQARQSAARVKAKRAQQRPNGGRGPGAG